MIAVREGATSWVDLGRPESAWDLLGVLGCPGAPLDAFFRTAILPESPASNARSWVFPI